MSELDYYVTTSREQRLAGSNQDENIPGFMGPGMNILRAIISKVELNIHTNHPKRTDYRLVFKHWICPSPKSLVKSNEGGSDLS
jgi:hypothetical protein